MVAISYYAVNLAAYAIEPMAHDLDLSKGTLMAVLTPLVVLGVWLIVRRNATTLTDQAPVALSPPYARVQRVAQTVTDVVHAQHRQRDCNAGPKHSLRI